MSILKIILVPLSLILSLFVWLCAGLLSCSGFVFKLASGLLSLLAIAVMITYSVKNGIILLVLAFLISPMGLAVHIVIVQLPQIIGEPLIPDCQQTEEGGLASPLTADQTEHDFKLAPRLKGS